MIREGVKITPLLIEKPKQVKIFQIRIPREAENIIGFEMDFIGLEGVPAAIPATSGVAFPSTFRRNIVLGELRIQSYEKPNVFFGAQLSINQNLDFGDISSLGFAPKPYTHQCQQNETSIKVSGKTTLLQGVYRDKLIDYQPGAYKYIVKLYTWMQALEDQSKL